MIQCAVTGTNLAPATVNAALDFCLDAMRHSDEDRVYYLKNSFGNSETSMTSTLDKTLGSP